MFRCTLLKLSLWIETLYLIYIHIVWSLWSSKDLNNIKKVYWLLIGMLITTDTMFGTFLQHILFLQHKIVPGIFAI